VRYIREEAREEAEIGAAPRRVLVVRYGSVRRSACRQQRGAQQNMWQAHAAFRSAVVQTAVRALATVAYRRVMSCLSVTLAAQYAT